MIPGVPREFCICCCRLYFRTRSLARSTYCLVAPDPARKDIFFFFIVNDNIVLYINTFHTETGPLCQALRSFTNLYQNEAHHQDTIPYSSQKGGRSFYVTHSIDTVRHTSLWSLSCGLLDWESRLIRHVWDTVDLFYPQALSLLIRHA